MSAAHVRRGGATRSKQRKVAKVAVSKKFAKRLPVDQVGVTASEQVDIPPLPPELASVHVSVRAGRRATSQSTASPIRRMWCAARALTHDVRRRG